MITYYRRCLAQKFGKSLDCAQKAERPNFSSEKPLSYQRGENAAAKFFLGRFERFQRVDREKSWRYFLTVVRS
jgi:hypothetical protein